MLARHAGATVVQSLWSNQPITDWASGHFMRWIPYLTAWVVKKKAQVPRVKPNNTGLKIKVKCSVILDIYSIRKVTALS